MKSLLMGYCFPLLQMLWTYKGPTPLYSTTGNEERNNPNSHSKCI